MLKHFYDVSIVTCAAPMSKQIRHGLKGDIELESKIEKCLMARINRSRYFFFYDNVFIVTTQHNTFFPVELTTCAVPLDPLAVYHHTSH
eukprot:TRINITY_DN17023_c0_g1_i1.p1 TRINITY_DN17023_c0_g1~~TRINITY_DN17023_c0_g1_i1.p1  ORF type:complete len:89 (+),score=6.84 TRINITY_DN17023_c0_g1_i1:170-436(+)